MALTIYAGRAGTGKSHSCYTRIQELLENEQKRPIILLVPDSVAYQVERKLAEMLPNQGFTRVWVVGFSRLRHHILQSVGKKRSESISDVGQQLLLRSILKKREQELQTLGGVAKRSGFANILRNLFNECAAFCITATDLYKGASHVSSPFLKHKLEDVALLFTDYVQALEELGITDSLEELIEALPQSPLLREAYVFIDGFQWFTPIQRRLMETIIDYAQDTVLTLTLPMENIEQVKKSWNIFNRPGEIYHKLIERYPDCKIVSFTEAKRYSNRSLQQLERDYFGIPSLKQKENQHIPIWEAYNGYREVDAIGREILALMETKQYRWRDITIMLRDSETYGAMLEQALQRYEIPYFSDRRHPMITHPLAEFLTSFLELLQYPFVHDILFRLLKTDLWPLSRNEVDELENYCLEFGILPHQWLSGNEWSKRKGLALSKKSNEENDEESGEELVDDESVRLKRINQIRCRILDICLPFFEFSKNAQTAKSWSTELFFLLQKLEVPGRLTAWYEEAKTAGIPEEAAKHEQMYKRILVLLDELAQVGGKECFTVEEIAVLLGEGLESLTYSLVPPTLDHVTITTIERGYTSENKIVFVPGLNDGIFPKSMGDEGLLSDREREALAEVGTLLAPGALKQVLNENLLLYLALTRATEKLYLSYVSSSITGESKEPSLLVKRIQELNYCAPLQKIPLSIPVGREGEYVWRAKQSLSLWAQELEDIGKGKDVSNLWWQFYDWMIQSPYEDKLRLASKGLWEDNRVEKLDAEIVQTLFVKHHSLTGSVTRFENYYKCPYSFFARYGLQLKERPVQEFAQLERGTFLHENLRVLGEKLLAEHKQWRDLDEEERIRVCQQVVDELAQELQFGLLDSDPFYQNLKLRLATTLKRTVKRLSQWSAGSNFNTIALEQSFGRGDDGWKALYLPVTDDVSLRLQGQIDRIDEMKVFQEDEEKSYALVIDYKTGNASIQAQDVYYGLKLQLLTYLLALEKHQKFTPAGLVYTFVKNPSYSIKGPATYLQAESVALENGALKNSGYFLNDTEILENICHSDEMYSNMFLPVRLSKTGIHRSDVKKVKTVEEFSTLVDYTSKALVKAGEKILKGDFPISPYKEGNVAACEYCPYRALCRFEKGVSYNQYRYLSRLTEEEALEKMSEGGSIYGDEMD